MFSDFRPDSPARHVKVSSNGLVRRPAAADVVDLRPLDKSPEKFTVLPDTHDTFRKWLGPNYDTDALDITLAAVAVERMIGDPLWVLVVSGSGNAKTETVMSCAEVPGFVAISTITSDAALLSGTPAKDRAKDANGGLLRQLEPRGVLGIKDFTSILSMQADRRKNVLSAFREVYDGAWTRSAGVDGGRSLEWAGRIAIIGAVTTAWDTHHSVIAAMGDRFVLVRMDSSTHREESGRQALANLGKEDDMRAELSAAVNSVMANLNTAPVELTPDETDRIFAAADLVTRTRTAVEYDRGGNVSDAHAPESPTRFAKQLSQVVRGAIAIGVPRSDALRLAIRVARDSMPPLRLAILDDLEAQFIASPVADITKRLNRPRTTVDRQLQALHMLGLVKIEPRANTTIWHYVLADDVNPTVLHFTAPKGG